MRRSLLIPLLGLVIVATACTGGSSDGNPALGAQKISGTMPDLAGSTLQGGRLDPTTYRGDVTVVNFWATWCTPCRKEQPALERVWHAEQGHGVSMVGINYRDQQAAADAWIRDLKVTYPNVLDLSGSNGNDWPGFIGLPVTYVADATGQLRYRFYGGVTEDALQRVIDEVRAT